MTGPPDLSPRELVDRWLDRASLDRADQTVADYSRRLRHWVRFCESEEVESVADLEPWDVEAYDVHRRSRDLETITLRNELMTLRQVLRYGATRGLIDESVVEAIDPPDVSKAERTDDRFLSPSEATELIKAFRAGDQRHSRQHAFLELAWWTGARMGALRGLDLDDVNFSEHWVRFRHRPGSGTPLKNGPDGERVVGINEDVAAALNGYIDGPRPSSTDDHGRRPLFATAQGRCGTNTIRVTAYYATIPCRIRECPHGHERPTCEFASLTNCHGCPSSLSPHPIRSGSIMWQLNRGLRSDIVSDRVNASVDVIEDYYDKVSQLEEFRERRAHFIDRLTLEEPDSQ